MTLISVEKLGNGAESMRKKASGQKGLSEIQLESAVSTEFEIHQRSEDVINGPYHQKLVAMKAKKTASTFWRNFVFVTATGDNEWTKTLEERY